MSSLLGRIDEFDGTKEDWPQYVERVDHFFDVNGITDVDKKSAFLAVIGPTTYALVRNLVSPAKPGEKSYDELVKILKEHYRRKQSSVLDFMAASGSLVRLWLRLFLNCACWQSYVILVPRWMTCYVTD